MSKCTCNACKKIVTHTSNRMESHLRVCVAQNMGIGLLKSATAAPSTSSQEFLSPLNVVDNGDSSLAFRTPMSVPSSANNKDDTRLQVVPKSTNSRQPSALEFAEKWSLNQQNNSVDLLAAAMHLNCLPFETFNKPEWMSFFASLRKGFIAPSPEDVGGKLLDTQYDKIQLKSQQQPLPETTSEWGLFNLF